MAIELIKRFLPNENTKNEKYPLKASSYTHKDNKTNNL